MPLNGCPERLPGDDARLPRELVCAALDSAQLWALMLHAPPATSDRVVTVTLETLLDAPVISGEPHVVLGWPIGREGRRWLAAPTSRRRPSTAELPAWYGANRAWLERVEADRRRLA